jgi:serine/threonine-protein kinase
MNNPNEPGDQLPTADWDRPNRPAAPGATPSPTIPALPSDEQVTLPKGPVAGVPAAVGADGRYVLLAEVASGGMGVVYLGEDRVVGRRVALKMIRAGFFACVQEVERFTREARALALLSHPHVVQVYDFGQSEGRPFFTMQLAPGGTLAGHLDRYRADARAAVALVEKVARGVQHAHQQGILHRDLKPANVLLGGGDEPLVSDFGLVKFLHAEGDGLTQAGPTPGTPAYMAPEQAGGRAEEVGPRTDVWSLGVILYELVAGRRPFEGRTREEVLHRILTTPVPPPRTLRPALDPALEAVLLKCLEKEPGRRYGSAGALAEDLARWLVAKQLATVRRAGHGPGGDPDRHRRLAAGTSVDSGRGGRQASARSRRLFIQHFQGQVRRRAIARRAALGVLHFGSRNPPRGRRGGDGGRLLRVQRLPVRPGSVPFAVRHRHRRPG